MNVEGTARLLEAFRQHVPSAKVLVVSTSHVYGDDHNGPISEESALAPTSPYAVSKAAAGLITRSYAHSHGMHTMIARPSNHTGPGQSECFVVPSLVSQVRDMCSSCSAPRIEVGNLASERDFTDVRDVVRAYRLLLAKGHCGEAYNIASGKQVRVGTILETLCKSANIDPEIVVEPGKYRPTDRSPTLSTKKIQEHTGWQPSMDFSATLQEMLEFC